MLLDSQKIEKYTCCAHNKLYQDQNFISHSYYFMCRTSY